MNQPVNSELFSVGLSELPQLAQTFLALIEQTNVSILLFEGELGSGKTTFIQQLCMAFGVADTVNSPTYAIINQYEGSGVFRLLYHMDLYRLNSLEEALDIGLLELLDSGNLCLIEWPRWTNTLVDDYLHINIVPQLDGKRNFVVQLFKKGQSVPLPPREG